MDDPDTVLLRVSLESGYWDTPGNVVATMLSLVKSKVTGETLDADHGTVSDPPR